MKITPEEARIVAHVCGDGWLTKYIDRNSLQIVKGKRYRQKRMRYVIGYSNKEEDLLNQFRRDVIKVYNISARRLRTKNEIRVRSKRIYDKIKSLGGNDSRNWFISREILKSSRMVKAAWLGAFFDDEATVDSLNRRIRIKSVNYKGLLYAKKLLFDMNIGSVITGQNSDKTWYLTVKDLSGFIKFIELCHKNKAIKLKKCLNG